MVTDMDLCLCVYVVCNWLSTWICCRYYGSKHKAVGEMQPIRIQQTSEAKHETSETNYMQSQLNIV